MSRPRKPDSAAPRPQQRLTRGLFVGSGTDAAQLRLYLERELGIRFVGWGGGDPPLHQRELPPQTEFVVIMKSNNLPRGQRADLAGKAKTAGLLVFHDTATREAWVNKLDAAGIGDRQAQVLLAAEAKAEQARTRVAPTEAAPVASVPSLEAPKAAAAPSRTPAAPVTPAQPMLQPMRPEPRRSYGDADLERMLRIIHQNAGQLAERQIRAFGSDPMVAKRILLRLREMKVVRTTGDKRATRYWPTMPVLREDAPVLLGAEVIAAEMAKRKDVAQEASAPPVAASAAEPAADATKATEEAKDAPPVEAASEPVAEPQAERRSYVVVNGAEVAMLYDDLERWLAQLAPLKRRAMELGVSLGISIGL